MKVALCFPDLGGKRSGTAPPGTPGTAPAGTPATPAAQHTNTDTKDPPASCGVGIQYGMKGSQTNKRTKDKEGSYLLKQNFLKIGG